MKNIYKITKRKKEYQKLTKKIANIILKLKEL